MSDHTTLDDFINQLEELRDEHGNVPVVDEYEYPAQASYNDGKVWVGR